MILRLKYYISSSTDPYENLAVEKYLTIHTPPDTCVLYLWQNERTVVIGKNQDAYRECRLDLLEADGGRLARRPSGGGAVFHDMGNLNFSFCIGRRDYDLSRQMQVPVLALKGLGLSASLSGRNDVTVDGYKVSGNAFFKSGDHCCHHGTLLINTNVADMSRYLTVSDAKLRSNGVASVRSRVANIRALAPSGAAITAKTVRQAMLDAFGRVYAPGAGVSGNALSPVDLSREAGEAIEKFRQEFARREWIFGPHIRCSREFQGRFFWGEITVLVELSGNRIRKAQVISDAMDPDMIDALKQELTGIPFEGAALEKAAKRAVSAARDPQGNRLADALAGQIKENIRGLFYGI